MTIGESGKPSDTGYELNKSPVKRAAGPFHRVTNVAVLHERRHVHRRRLRQRARPQVFRRRASCSSRGASPGSGPGQFMLPHGIAVDSAGLVYVADRENSRVQVFTPDGEYVREWGRDGLLLNRPYDIFIDDQDMLHIAEGGFHNYMMKRSEGPLPAHDETLIYPPCGHSPIARVTVCDPDGKIAAQVGGENPVLPGNFIAPHGIWVGQARRHVRRRSRVQRRRGQAHGAAQAARVPEIPPPRGLKPRPADAGLTEEQARAYMHKLLGAMSPGGRLGSLHLGRLSADA